MTNEISTPRDRRVQRLARATADLLVKLAERCVEGAAMVPDVLLGPEVGMVMMQVREPVTEERFYLGEVLVTRAQVSHRGVQGWSMRMGSERAATLAAAICDAEAEAGGPLSADIEDLCARTEAEGSELDEAEWATLAPTIVRFEGLS